VSNDANQVAADQEPATAEEVGIRTALILLERELKDRRMGSYAIMKQIVMDSVQAGMNQITFEVSFSSAAT
jgi:hypothetical protein